jgi:Rrf2 family transcriptional regulator, iron-sulfur cluster assembly transcription factor
MQLINRGTDYATRTMLYVAGAVNGDTATTQEIAERQGISQVFLSKIVQRLVQAGLLRTYRGASGGVTLSQPPSDINLRQIIEAMEGPITLNRCLTGPGECFRENICPLHEVWLKAQEDLLTVLESTTLDRLVMRGKELAN